MTLIGPTLISTFNRIFKRNTPFRFPAKISR
ncbi:hypothetical protein [Caudoviricetes sp.]|nr:hypothetical protein [Caudoviricetes sp.]UOF81542.1 hypothetical protein [Caudoviricetes sp.]